jgi:hypothetical protein
LDDGIVVEKEVSPAHRVEEYVYMRGPNLGLRLRDKLGPEASQDLSDAFTEVQQDMNGLRQEMGLLRQDMIEGFAKMRVEMNEEFAKIRLEMAEGFAKIRVEMAETRADILKWSLLFWLGQFAATAALIATLLRWVPR